MACFSSSSQQQLRHVLDYGLRRNDDRLPRSSRASLDRHDRGSWVAYLPLADTTRQAADPMQAFPPAEQGMVRRVLLLPPQEDESLFQVELVAGKIVAVDPHNRYFFGGSITEDTIKGWGYTRYTVSALGPLAGTRMAVPPETPTEPRFVPLAGEPLLIRYNSRLPVVVYAPAEVEVRYRIWRTEMATQPIEIQ